LADTVKISWVDGTHEIELDGTKVEYHLDKNLTTVSTPVLKALISGTTTATTANKLVDSTKDFITNAYEGMLVFNTTDSTFAFVTVIDSTTTLTLSKDIMTSGEGYELWPTPTMKVMDFKQINESFTINCGLSGVNSTNDLIKLIGLAYNTDNEPLKFTWRERVFNDCWIKGISVIDIMSISGTTENGESQTFGSGQVNDDTLTYTITIMLIKGTKIA